MINKLNKKRKILRIIRALSIFFVILMSFSTILYFIYSDSNIFLYFDIVLIVLAIIFLLLYVFLMKKFVIEYKEFSVAKYLGKDFTNVKFKLKGKFNSAILKLMNLNQVSKFTDDYNREVRQSDFIEGTYKNIKFKQSDLVVKETKTYDFGKDSKGNRNEYSKRKKLFSGIITEFDISLSDESILISTYDFNTISHPFIKVEVKNSNFNDFFDVTSTDETKALSYLTYNKIEKIMDVSENVLSGEFFILIHNNKLYLGQNGVINTFEPDLTEKITEENIIKNMVESTWYVKPFIERLLLNKR